MFRPVEPANLRYEKVVLQIKSAISSGELKPGDKLPPERELAKLFGVSRTSIREALKSLATSGLITIRHGDGAYVSEPRLENELASLAGYLLDRQGTLMELLELRKVLETQAAAWAAERGDPDKMRELAGLIVVGRDGIRKRSGGLLSLLTEHDTKFHLCLADAAGNQVYVRVMNHLLDLLIDSRVKAWSIPGRPLKSLEEHAKVVDAIVRRDPEGAKEAMRQHLESLERDISK